MELKTVKLRSLIDPNRNLITYHNTNTVTMTLSHEEAQPKRVYITINKTELKGLIKTLQVYLAEMESTLPERGTMTDDEVIAKFRKRVTL